MKKFLIGAIAVIGLNAEAGRFEATIKCQSPIGHRGIEIKFDKFLKLVKSATLHVPYNIASLGCVIDEHEGYDSVNCVGLFHHAKNAEERLVKLTLSVAGRYAKGGVSGAMVEEGQPGTNDLICSVE